MKKRTEKSALDPSALPAGCAVRDPFKEVLDDLDEIADKLTSEGLNNLAVSALEAHRRLRNQSETIKQLQEKMHNISLIKKSEVEK